MSLSKIKWLAHHPLNNFITFVSGKRNWTSNPLQGGCYYAAYMVQWQGSLLQIEPWYWTIHKCKQRKWAHRTNRATTTTTKHITFRDTQGLSHQKASCCQSWTSSCQEKKSETRVQDVWGLRGDFIFFWVVVTQTKKPEDRTASIGSTNIVLDFIIRKKVNCKVCHIIVKNMGQPKKKEIRITRWFLNYYC